MTSFHLSVLSVFVMMYSVTKGKNTTLLLVQTLSRHGDRAPSILYPNNLNSENCWPNGLGQLTQLGWKQQLDTGKFLWSLYRGHVTQDTKQAMVFALLSCFLFCMILKGAYSSIVLPNHTYVEPDYLQNLLIKGQFEEFAALLQIDDVNLVKPAEGKPADDPMFNEGLEGGDILLRPWQREEARQGEIFKASDSRWKRVVPYVIDSKGYTSEERAAILKAIGKWNRDLFWYIRFRPRTWEKDYVMFFNGTGCYSNLGKVGGQQPISLRAYGCLSEGTILHEMAHTVGIIHEHDRPDRDKYIKILSRNIPERWRSQYEKSSFSDIKILGSYDYYSVMHYPVPAPLTGLPAFEVLQKGVDLSKIGQRVEQTKIDKDKIKRLYR